MLCLSKERVQKRNRIFPLLCVCFVLLPLIPILSDSDFTFLCRRLFVPSCMDSFIYLLNLLRGFTLLSWAHTWQMSHRGDGIFLPFMFVRSTFSCFHCIARHTLLVGGEKREKKALTRMTVISQQSPDGGRKRTQAFSFPPTFAIDHAACTVQCVGFLL